MTTFYLQGGVEVENIQRITIKTGCTNWSDIVTFVVKELDARPVIEDDRTVFELDTHDKQRLFKTYMELMT